jgi:hypothetical protein
MPINIVKTKMRAPRICCYGQHGIGKSSLGASAPSPLFIDLEGGLEALGVDATERCNYFQDVLDAIDHLTKEQHNFKTIVIDTLDWLEKLIYADVCAQLGKSDIAEVGFGRGYVAAETRWAKLFKALDELRESKNMITILNCHARIVEFKDPERENYDTYTLDLYQGKNVDTVNMVCEWVDILAFINFKVIAQKGESLNDKAKAKGTGQRYMFLKQKPSFLAKCRYSGFPDSVEYIEGSGWSAIAAELKKFKALQNESSKAGNLVAVKEEREESKKQQ